MNKLFLFLFVSLISLVGIDAQEAQVQGKVTDIVTGQGIEFVTVYVEGTTVAAETNIDGDYSIKIPSSISSILVFSRIGYKEQKQPVLLANSEVLELNVDLPSVQSDIEVVVTSRKVENNTMIREEVTTLKLIPSTSGNFESILPNIALGTTSGSGGELSSQYNVRGGNYDENLVYVNDFEIYRPQLIREGQQEGLSFPNIDLIRDLQFSSGGFAAKYGDKLSSVLDVRYKRPDSLRSSISASLLGASIHTEGSIKSKKSSYKKFRYLLGGRYKTNEYLLGSLDIQGEYAPTFWDFQAYLTYDLSDDLQIDFLGNYNSSVYGFTPQERSTAFGLIDFALNLSTLYEGQETNDYTTGLGGLSLTYIPDRLANPLFLKLLASRYSSLERESFDIIGAYRLAQVESSFDSEDFGDEIAVLGTGVQHRFARNKLRANITNVEFKGGLELASKDTSAVKSNFIQWGIKYQREEIEDSFKEWEKIDSAGFSLPFSTESVEVLSSVRSENNLVSDRFTGYVQNTYSFFRKDRTEWKITGGVRANYWTLNKELLISPRVQMAYKPLKSTKDISFRLSSGLYHQAPFFRELRRPDGSVNRDLKAQKSAHLVGGLTYDFYIGKRNPKPFRLIAEAYYKSLWDVVTYEIDNVRIRYSGENDATGSVMGLDLRLNGEFVPGSESWVNVSLLRAREALDGVTHRKREEGDPEEGVIVSDVARPSDRALTFAMFFQDHLPSNENFKMHLQMTFGTGFPFGLKDDNTVFRNTYRFSSYQRIDLGFSFLLWKHEWRGEKPNHLLKPFRNVWASLEVFNLMNVRNQSSQSWIRTIYGQQFSIPNFLTTRRINLKFKVDF